jgi:hypothetical protein
VTDQSNAAAERSAHVERGAARRIPGESFLAEVSPGVVQLKAVAEAIRERDEAIATLALYRAENGCTRGQRTTQWCGEASKLRRAWLRVIQLENGCPPSGGGCLSEQCGCIAEMQALSEYAGASHD